MIKVLGVSDRMLTLWLYCMQKDFRDGVILFIKSSDVLSSELSMQGI
jgi:hypothetical protein